MDLLLQLLSLCCVLAVLFSYKTRTSSRKGPQAPEPSGALPLLGHLHLLRGDVTRTTGSMADELGPAFILRLGLNRALFVSSWELAKECFTTNDLAMASRPLSLAGKHLAYDYAMIGFSPYGPYWRQMRKIMTIQLLSAKRLESLKHIRLAEIDMSIKALHRDWLKQGGEKVVLDLRQWLGDLSFNVMTMILAGKRYFGSRDISDEDEARRFKHAMEQTLYLMGVFVVGDALPFLRWMDLGGHESAMKRAVNELDSLMDGWLADHRRKREKQGKVDGGDRDFIDVLLSILEDEPFPGYENDTVIKGAAGALILAGTDTSTATLSWALSLLLNNRPKLKKAQDELDMRVGRDRHVEDSDIKNLVYLQAIIKETLRLYPVVPLLLPHESIEDCTVGGFHIPAGTLVFFNVRKIHRDPKIWSDPSEFQPERFLGNHSHIDMRGQHFEYLPFGSGRRICPGITFGTQVIHLTLARLLQAFDLDTSNGKAVDMTEGLGLTMPRATPLQVLLTPRLPSHLYDK